MTDEAKKIVDALRDQDDCDMLKKCDGCVREKYCYAENGENLETDAADLIERMSAELERVKRERDAAVHDLSLNANCTVCNNYAKCAEWMATRCAGFIDSGNVSPFFEWRGVCAENSKEDNEQ